MTPVRSQSSLPNVLCCYICTCTLHLLKSERAGIVPPGMDSSERGGAIDAMEAATRSALTNTTVPSAAAPSPPTHVIFLLVDDWGRCATD